MPIDGGKRMAELLDVITGILWSITYLLIVIYAFKYRNEKKIMMPLIPGSICIAWELNALIVSQGFWVHVLWLLLDIFIFVFNILNISKPRNRILYIFMTLFWIALFAITFRINVIDIMFISSFLLDLGIAIGYVVRARTISSHGKIPIAITKLLGDFCAWMCYSRYSGLIVGIGAAVFLFNLYYIALCLEENSFRSKPKSKRR